jgi:hypothetical protein
LTPLWIGDAGPLALWVPFGPVGYCGRCLQMVWAARLPRAALRLPRGDVRRLTPAATVQCDPSSVLSPPSSDLHAPRSMPHALAGANLCAVAFWSAAALTPLWPGRAWSEADLGVGRVRPVLRRVFGDKTGRPAYPGRRWACPGLIYRRPIGAATGSADWQPALSPDRQSADAPDIRRQQLFRRAARLEAGPGSR